MKTIVILFSAIILLSIVGCHKEVVTLSEYETTILSTAISKDIPQLQSKNESELLKKLRVKSMSFVEQQMNSSYLDSITFVEFDEEGKILRRTTTENTTEGCLPYMMRQEFTYDDNKIKRVTNYTFKYKANSVLENWMIKDTSELLIFDLEDYSYNADTILVESGPIICKFIRDAKGNIIKTKLLAKTNNQTIYRSYNYSDSPIIREINNDYGTFITNYTIEKNHVLITSKDGDKEYLEELVFESNGLLKSKILYTNGENISKTIVTYSYY